MTEPEKRPPSLTKDIRTLLQKAGWAHGGEFSVTDSGCLKTPDDLAYAFHHRERAEFVAIACNHFITELQLERAAVKIAQDYAAMEQKAREGKGRRR